ncbi:MAG: hypothetical protein HGB17_16590, partial [Syntrophobacteraceae bacterium]|nr:hypothetical protein [Syntrophobacteraceae bacterium]
GLAEFDVKPFVEAGIYPDAIFDFDSTVVDGNIMDPFLAVLIERKLVREDANPKVKEYLGKLTGVDMELVGRSSAVENARLLLTLWADTKLPEANRPTAKDMFYLIVSMMKGMTVGEAEGAAEAAYLKGGGQFPPYQHMVYDDPSGCGMRRIIALLEERGIKLSSEARTDMGAVSTPAMLEELHQRKQALKQELMAQMNKIIKQGQVKDVFFTDFIVQ